MPRVDCSTRAGDSWADHFELAGDSLKVRSEDADATRTWWVYDVDSEEKQALRRRRRVDHGRRLRAYQGLLDLLSEERPEASDEQWERMRTIWREALELVWRDLQRWRAVPENAPRDCSCHDVSCEAPAWLLETAVEVEPPV